MCLGLLPGCCLGRCLGVVWAAAWSFLGLLLGRCGRVARRRQTTAKQMFRPVVLSLAGEEKTSLDAASCVLGGEGGKRQ